MKKLLTLSVMFILCLLTFATDFMRIKLKDGNIARYEVDNIEEVDFEIGKDTSIIGDTTAVDTSASPLRFRITSGSTAEVSGYRYYYNNTDSIAIPEKVRINGKIYNVTSIGDGVFGGYSGLTSISIPESVTSIGAEAFIGCSDLTRINIPEGVTRIDSSTFARCSSLREITLPKNVTSIGISAFSGCNGLKSIQIPSSVTDIDKFAFYRCINLDVTIDNSEGNVKVGEFAFEGCKSVTYLKNNDITAIDTSDTPLKFRITSDSTAEVIRGNYSNLDSISIPAKVRIGDKIYSVTSIGDDAFRDYSELTSIEIPSSVTSIGSYVFTKCNNLTSIDIPESVTSIGKYVFYGCSSLTSIQIPEGVTSIGNSAFKGCSSLTSIQIPEGVTSIGESAFYGCHNADIVIDNFEGNVSVGYNAFEGCKSVTYLKNNDITAIDASDTPLKFSITSDSTAEVIEGRGNYSNLDSISIPAKVRIGDKIYNVTSIGIYAFEEWSWLKNIQIPNSVTSIGDFAFYGCSGLTSIKIPEGVTSIGDQAFEYCSSLTSIKIPESVTSIGINAFDRCDNLEPKLLIYDNGTKCYGWIGDKRKCTNVVIHEGVTSIKESAFSDCSSLTSIDIPESVTSIGSSAFSGCNSLEAKLLIYDKGTKCYGWIGDRTKCTNVVIPEGVTSIGKYAFWGCSSLNSIKIPEGVTSIGSSAFRGCSSLTSINIPESVTSIGWHAFGDCSNLDVIIDNSENNVTIDAFNDCKSVTYLK